MGLVQFRAADKRPSFYGSRASRIHVSSGAQHVAGLESVPSVVLTARLCFAMHTASELSQVIFDSTSSSSSRLSASRRSGLFFLFFFFFVFFFEQLSLRFVLRVGLCRCACVICHSIARVGGVAPEPVTAVLF